jgi:hypothetical protein
MPKEKKPTKVHTQIRIMKTDLKDLIRDEIYGAALADWPTEMTYGGKRILCIPMEEVAGLAKRIAKRAVIGH